jgi:hypothetical protein
LIAENGLYHNPTAVLIIRRDKHGFTPRQSSLDLGPSFVPCSRFSHFLCIQSVQRYQRQTDIPDFVEQPVQCRLIDYLTCQKRIAAFEGHDGKAIEPVGPVRVENAFHPYLISGIAAQAPLFPHLIASLCFATDISR